MYWRSTDTIGVYLITNKYHNKQKQHFLKSVKKHAKYKLMCMELEEKKHEIESREVGRNLQSAPESHYSSILCNVHTLGPVMILHTFVHTNFNFKCTRRRLQW